MNLFGKKDLDIFEEINHPAKDNGTVLKEQHKRNIRNILSKDRSILKSTDENGRTPLVAALDRFDKDAIDIIINFNPPNINELFYTYYLNDKVTPLMFAIYRGYSVDYVKKFMKHGANLNVKSSKGKTVFDYTQMSKAANSKKVLEYLQELHSASNVIKKHWKSHREHEYYKPGGQGYYEAKKHFETAFGKKRTNLKTLRSDLKKVLK